MTKKKLHEQLGLSVEETLNRLIGLGQLIHKYEQEHGEKLTPEVRNFAWLVNQDALQGFWEAAQQYAKYEQEKVASFLILKGES